MSVVQGKRWNTSQQYRYEPTSPSILIQAESSGLNSPDAGNYARQRVVVNGTEIHNVDTPRSHQLTILGDSYSFHGAVYNGKSFWDYSQFASTTPGNGACIAMLTTPNIPVHVPMDDINVNTTTWGVDFYYPGESPNYITDRLKSILLNQTITGPGIQPGTTITDISRSDDWLYEFNTVFLKLSKTPLANKAFGEFTIQYPSFQKIFSRMYDVFNNEYNYHPSDPNYTYWKSVGAGSIYAYLPQYHRVLWDLKYLPQKNNIVILSTYDEPQRNDYSILKTLQDYYHSNLNSYTRSYRDMYLFVGSKSGGPLFEEHRPRWAPPISFTGWI